MLAVVCVAEVASAKLVAAPGEQITSFEADILVNRDATLIVREDFVVHSEASYFMYCFIRNLPIDDKARWDERYAGKWTADNGIRVKILELTENGAPVSYQEGGGFGYPQLRIGPLNVRSRVAITIIRYTVDGAVGFGSAHDTLVLERDRPLLESACWHGPRDGAFTCRNRGLRREQRTARGRARSFQQ